MFVSKLPWLSATAECVVQNTMSAQARAIVATGSLAVATVEALRA